MTQQFDSIETFIQSLEGIDYESWKSIQSAVKDSFGRNWGLCKGVFNRVCVDSAIEFASTCQCCGQKYPASKLGK